MTYLVIEAGSRAGIQEKINDLTTKGWEMFSFQMIMLGSNPHYTAVMQKAD